MTPLSTRMVEAAAEAAYSRGQNMGPWLSLPTKMKAEWRNDIRAALTAVAPLMAQAEREACARVAGEHADHYLRMFLQDAKEGKISPHFEHKNRAALDIAAAIRARSTEEGQ